MSSSSALSSRNRVKYCTVTFDSGEGSGVESQKMLSGNSASKPGDPVRSGYTFTGWYKDAECTEIYDFSTGVVEDTKLYAGWKADTVPVSENKDTKPSSDDAASESDDD